MYLTRRIRLILVDWSRGSDRRPEIQIRLLCTQQSSIGSDSQPIAIGDLAAAGVDQAVARTPPNEPTGNE
jgi:hypothetical protein